jgi:TRAP-type C4-dicarboxylate transport system substrate-binding protein
MRRHTALAAVLAVVAAGCGGSGGDKAGGQEATVAEPIAPVGKRVTLTLVAVDPLWAEEFAAAARRLSGGTIRIEIRGGGSAIVDYERRLVDKVRAGEADLVSVGARAWDLLGVTSVRALVAPFLVDSNGLQRRVLESQLVDRMLAGLEPLGLVGLAILPGPLRRPLGLKQPLLGPRDYEGIAFGIRNSRVAKATLAALGATTKRYRIGSLAGLDGAELDPGTIAGNGYDAPGAKLTANVVLWARPETIAISRSAFDRLPAAQREILRRAGREAVAPALARVESEQQESLGLVCGRGKLTLATATPSELAALRAAVQPVYDSLERDVQTRRLITEIRALRTARAGDGKPLVCVASRTGASELEGVWQSNVSRAAMLAAGASAAEAATYEGRGTLELAHGRWTFDGERASVTGTYAVAGDALRLTMLTCTANPCDPGASSDYTWSVYRDALTLTRRPGRAAWPRLVAKPSRRVG